MSSALSAPELAPSDQPAVPPALPPQVSVVVPTVNRVRLLERCLDGLAAQEDVRFEVLVVHDGNPGILALLEVWKHHLPLRPIRISARGASAKRNAGWRHARAPIIAFTDDDCEPASGWLSEALPAFDDPDVTMVQGRVLAHPCDHTVEGRYARTIEVTAPLATYPNANLIYRVSALEAAGGYDEGLNSGEDTDLAWRVLACGGRAAFVDSALVWHAVRRVDFVAHLRSLPRWRSLPEVVRRHPELRSLAHRKVFWKDTHPKAWLSLAGLALGAVHPAALALMGPHLAARRHPGLMVSDWTECLVMAAGSVRSGAVLL